MTVIGQRMPTERRSRIVGIFIGLGIAACVWIIWVFATQIFVPIRWNGVAFDASQAECVTGAKPDDYLLRVPITAYTADYHIDDVEFLGARRLEVHEASIERGSATLAIDGQTSLDSGVEYWLSVPFHAAGSGGADGLRLRTSTGEPIYAQDFSLLVSVSNDRCTL